MTSRLEGRVALVTGGTRGIGEAIAGRLAQEGATVVVASRKAPNVEEAVARLQQIAPDRIFGKTMHLGDVARIDAVVSEVEDEHGPIDILINNAAANPYFGPMVDCPPSAFAKTFDVNVGGTFELTRRVVSRLVALEKPGAVLTIASIMGQQAAPLQGVYGMTKAALISMTETLAVELGPAGIRVNAIAPGLVETKFASVLTNTPHIRKMFEERTALLRIAQPSEIAGTAAWLVSDDATYVTGQTITVDGGYTIR